MTSLKRPVKKPKRAAAKASLPLRLQDTQALFQDAILNGSAGILDMLCDNSKTTRDTLFGVYRNAYAGRLAEILANDFEDLAAYMGEDAFEGAAYAYIAANPSHAPNARWYSNRFPAFLRGFPETCARAQLADLADLEVALADAFDAADAPPLQLQDLAAFAPEDWGRLTFAPHPSARLLACTTDTFGLWQALQTGEDVPDAYPPLDQKLIVWRHETTPMVRKIAAEEAMMWVEACRGLRFDALCEMLAIFDAPDDAAARAAGYLQGWLTSGLLTGAKLADASGGSDA